MRVETTRFGRLEVNDDSIINMTSGLLGFETYKRFCLVKHREGDNFQWLQSVEEPSLAFVVIDPSEYFSHYEVDINDSDVENLCLESAEDAILLSVVTIRDGGSVVTANLAAPIVINAMNNMGSQVVLRNEHYTTQHALIAKQAEQEVAVMKAA